MKKICRKKISLFLKGKRFLNKCKSWRKDFDFEQYEPFIIPHKYDENKLYCALTKTSLNKAGGEVLKHVRGRRYQAALKVHEENKAKGKKKGKRKQEDEGDVEENDEEEEDEDDQEEEEEEYNDEEEEEDQGNSGDVEGGIYADELVHDSGKRSLIVIDEEGGVVFQRNKKRKKKGKKKKKKKKV